MMVEQPVTGHQDGLVMASPPRDPETRLGRAALALEVGLTSLEQHGRGDDASVVRQRLQGDRTRPPTVVVVGEAKRGKSSLVNTLIGRAELSPVDADIATGTFIESRPAGEVGEDRVVILLRGARNAR
jgi:hypothetical protein